MSIFILFIVHDCMMSSNTVLKIGEHDSVRYTSRLSVRTLSHHCTLHGMSLFCKMKLDMMIKDLYFHRAGEIISFYGVINDLFTTL